MATLSLQGAARSSQSKAPSITQWGVRVTSGRFFGTRVSKPKRAGFRPRFSRDELETVTAEVAVPPVEWRHDFDDRYTLLSQVAAGSFGKVWRGRDRGNGKPVAIKRIRAEQATLPPETVREKVEREVSVLTDLQGHPGIVDFHGTFLHERQYSLVMDFCSGKDLRSNLKASGPISECLCAAVAWEILGVLRRCQQAKIVHGDVKAANFVVASGGCHPFRRPEVVELPSGWVKAVDFGAGRYLQGPQDVIRGRCGTLVYMAPEVFLGEYGSSADAWSLGVTLFFLLTGRYPWWESAQLALHQNVAQVKEAVLRQPLRIEAEASPCCLDFIRRLLVRDSQLRMTLEDAESHPFLQDNLVFCEKGEVILGSHHEASTPKTDLCPSSWLLEGM